MMIRVRAITIMLALILPCAARAADKAPDAEARSLYDEGVKLYNVQEYDRAIDAFKRAYLISKVPSLLYNIAQAYRQKGPASCRTALGFYQSYLREAPTAPDRPSIEVRVRELAECARREELAHPRTPESEPVPDKPPEIVTPTPTPTPTPVPVAAPVEAPAVTPAAARRARLAPLKTAAITLGSVSLAFLVLAPTFDGLSSREADALRTRCQPGVCTEADLGTLHSYERLAEGFYIALGVGAAATAGVLIGLAVRARR